MDSCPYFDAENQECKELGLKFYDGFYLPCLDLDDPQKCPILTKHPEMHDRKIRQRLGGARTYLDFRGKRVSARNMFIRGWINIIIIITLGLIPGFPIGWIVSLYIDMILGIIVGIIITLIPAILVVLRFVKKHGWRRAIEELGTTLYWGPSEE